VQEAAREMAGRGVIVQINTQENPGLAARFNITGVPTLLVFRDGKAEDRVSGAMDKINFSAWWRRQLSI
jgi:thioredoxin-like negative regulator of GroEL